MSNQNQPQSQSHKKSTGFGRLSQEEYDFVLKEAKETLEFSLEVTECLVKFLEWQMENIKGSFMDKRLLLEEIKERREKEQNLKNLLNNN